MRTATRWVLVLGGLGMLAAPAAAQGEAEGSSSSGEVAPQAEPAPAEPGSATPGPEAQPAEGDNAEPGPGIETPPVTLAPTLLPLRVPRKEAGVAFGLSRLSEAGFGLTTVTGALYVEHAPPDERFGIRLQLPVASADAALVGDVGMDLGWIVYARGDAEESSFVSVGLGFTIPVNLLNTLGGGNGEIDPRRRRRYPTVTALNILPIRYFQMTPHIGFLQRFGPVLLFGEVGGVMVLGCRYANIYDSPNVEAALQYGAGLAGQLFATGDGSTSFALGAELSGTHFFTTVAPVNISEARPQPPSGLSLAPSVRVKLAHRLFLHAGVAVALAGRHTWTRYTPSTLWQHDVTFYAQAGLPF